MYKDQSYRNSQPVSTMVSKNPKKCADCGRSLADVGSSQNARNLEQHYKKRCHSCVLKSDKHYTTRLVQHYRHGDGDGISVKEVIANPGFDINKIRLHHMAHWELYHWGPYKGAWNRFVCIHDWTPVWEGMTKFFIDLVIIRNKNKVPKPKDITKDKKFNGPIKRGYMCYDGNGIHAFVQVYDTDQVFYIHGGWS
jgi:hypothetical protein